MIILPRWTATALSTILDRSDTFKRGIKDHLQKCFYNHLAAFKDIEKSCINNEWFTNFVTCLIILSSVYLSCNICMRLAA